tara:strand:+ start:1240 stop:1878 length:639 start_codon:yes stop_codon:yes gene_type:complete
MDFSKAVSIFNNYTKNKLKGKIAHLELAPFRAKYPNLKVLPHKTAAVLVLLYPIDNETHFVLIERTKYKGKHSGQISFPGGKKEKGDFTIIDTALREAKEETNIYSEEVEIIGELSKIFIPPSNFEVTPILALSKKPPDFIPNKREVVKILEVKIKDLIHPKTVKKIKIEFDKGKTLNTPYFDLNSKVVWGATAMILNELKHYLLDIELDNN